MYLNKSVPEPPAPVTKTPKVIPDYVGLVRFLVEPFLESPESLSVDCEMSNGNARVWIRLAFEGEDKGRVFGRGGRNIQAIRTVIEACAQAAGQSVYLDIYGSSGQTREAPVSGGDRNGVKKSLPRRSPAPRSSSKIRF